MIVLDANYILRFLLNDNEEMFEISKKIIKNNKCFILNEVLSEVVFVLLKVYKVSKKEISQTLISFLNLNTIYSDDKNLLLEALKLFDNKRSLDFVDCILCAKSEFYKIKTFDKKLNKCIEAKNE
jgi:predicted nucleic-acid-binding protein